MKLLNRLLLVGLALAVPLTAAQAGSVIVGRKIEVDVDAQKVNEERNALWKKFGGWCAIADWHPSIDKCEESKEGEKTFRTLTLANDGGTVKEELIDQSRTSYKYAIIESPLPVKNYTAQFSIIPDDDDLDEVNFTWSATFDPKDKTAKEARDVIDGIFKDGLDAIEEDLGDNDG